MMRNQYRRRLDQKGHDGDAEDKSDGEFKATSYPTKWKFQGQKDDFPHLRNMIENEVMAEHGGGVRGRNFLFNFNPTNSEHAPVILPMPLEVNEDVNGIPATLEMCIRRDRQIEAARKSNQDYAAMEGACYKALQKFVNDSMVTKFVQLNTDPIACWEYLLTTFGPNSNGPADIGANFMAVIAMRMAHEDLFSSFVVILESKMELAGVTKVIAVGLLHSDGSGIYGIQMLPDRLMKAVRQCKHENKNFDETSTFLISVDSFQHQSGIGQTPTPKSQSQVMKIRNHHHRDESHQKSIFCANCYNSSAHSEEQCKALICGYCLQAFTGHNSANCPAKEAGHKKASVEKAKARVLQCPSCNEEPAKKNGKAKNSSNLKSKKRGTSNKKVAESDEKDEDDDEEDYVEYKRYASGRGVRRVKRVDDRSIIIDDLSEDSYE